MLFGGTRDSAAKDKETWIKVIVEEATRGDLGKALRILAIAATSAVILLICSLAFATIRDGNMRNQDSLNDLKEQMERAYWENVGFDMDALSQVPKNSFGNNMFIADSFGNRQKFIWDYFMPHYSCPQKERVGTMASFGDNGKWICGLRTLLQRRGCVVYSIGSNAEVSFEEGLLRHTKCEIHVFDPTLQPHQKALVLQLPGVHFHDYGLGLADGNMETSQLMAQTTSRGVQNVPVKSLPTIMRELGHTWVDVLKIDIEGGEWRILDHLTRQPGRFPFTQLQVEFHNLQEDNVDTDFMLKVMARLITKDMRVFSVEPNLWSTNNGFDFVEYAYIQVDKYGDVVVGGQGPLNILARRQLPSEGRPKCSPGQPGCRNSSGCKKNPNRG